MAADLEPHSPAEVDAKIRYAIVEKDCALKRIVEEWARIQRADVRIDALLEQRIEMLTWSRT